MTYRTTAATIDTVANTDGHFSFHHKGVSRQWAPVVDCFSEEQGGANRTSSDEVK